MISCLVMMTMGSPHDIHDYDDDYGHLGSACKLSGIGDTFGPLLHRIFETHIGACK